MTNRNSSDNPYTSSYDTAAFDGTAAFGSTAGSGGQKTWKEFQHDAMKGAQKMSDSFKSIDWNNIRQQSGSKLNNFLRANLHRSTTDKYFAGVLGGIAETYGINSTLVRLLFLASFLLPGPQAILYFIMWFVMPKGY